MKRTLLCLVLFSLAAFAVPAFSQVGKDLSGPHYNLNIIGVPKDKTVPSMTDTSRHTIFVPLQTNNGEVPRAVNIYYVAGDSFQVIDGNATDDNEATIMVPHEDYGDICYDVFAVGLGKPKGYAIVTPYCTWDDTVISGDCTDALLLDQFRIDRGKGKPKPQNISDVFRATGCVDTDADLACDINFSNIWIFNIPQLLEYFWDYDNFGLKLMQVRFYPTTCGTVTVQ